VIANSAFLSCCLIVTFPRVSNRHSLVSEKESQSSRIVAPPACQFLYYYHLPRKLTLYTMADPAKAETNQVFAVLKAGKGNKVRDAQRCRG
jgi:hypothetical protein